MNAVVFGAGKIGRGFLGQILFDGGYQTTFVDANAALVAALNARREYPLRLVGPETVEERVIARVRAISLRDADVVTVALAEADLAVTAVGAANLPVVMAALALGVAARYEAGARPLNMLLCENQWHAASLARQHLWPCLTSEMQDYAETHLGLVETVIGRMVPTPPPSDDPLRLAAEPYAELPISRAGLRGPAPTLPGLILADNFAAYEARKLYLHNAGHAALAYLGFQSGYRMIWQCVADLEVAAVCRAALAEAAQALVCEYGFAPQSLHEFSADLMARFASKALGDTVARVAADPLRKLRPEDRLVGAVRLCFTHGIAPTALAKVIAAALRYDDPDDPSAMALQQMRASVGDDGVLAEQCGITHGSELCLQILNTL